MEKQLTLKETIEKLAMKAAKKWNRSSETKKEHYECEGTSVIFEEVDDETYTKVSSASENFSLAEIAELGIDVSESNEDFIDDDVFDYLDDRMWQLVDELEKNK